ncbi:MAG: type II toxin-antitoxin system RelE/ParE family toxin [Flavobacteriales bacterium]|nr:type II toxin-antitoxin system RelE/ParE family toxin [Flavobacteriales bacterium]
MARQIVWSANAQGERLEILKYWADRNGSTRYSEKLDGMFRASLRLVAQHPKLGRTTSDRDVRMKSVGDHMLFYSITETEVHVLSVWHGKRNPQARPF